MRQTLVAESRNEMRVEHEREREKSLTRQFGNEENSSSSYLSRVCKIVVGMAHKECTREEKIYVVIYHLILWFNRPFQFQLTVMLLHRFLIFLSTQL